MKPFLLRIALSVFSFYLISCQPDKQETAILADTLVAGDPALAGMSASRLQKIDGLIEEYIEKGWIPGAEALIVRKGTIVYHKAFGMKDIEMNDPLEKNDIFRIASMTKAITSVAVMTLYEDGLFLLDDPVSRYIPEFKDPRVLLKTNPDGSYESRPAENEITIRHLLTHTSGIGYGFIHKELQPIYNNAGIPDGFVITSSTLGQSVPALAQLPLLHEPGARFTYGLNTDVLGYFVEVMSGKSFGEYLREEIFEPLGMEDTYFYPPEGKLVKLAIVYAEDESGIQKSEDARYDYPLKGSKTYESGGAGLCSTAMDYTRFMQMLINGGKYNGHQILAPKSIALMTMDHTGGLFGQNSFGLGFGITTEETVHQQLSSVGNYWWGGYFHTHFWLDPTEDLVAALMLQMYPVLHGEIEQKFQVLTYQSIIDLNQ